MKVEIYSDIVCPWCYIGERRFERALQAIGPAAGDVEVLFRPYQLDPGAPVEPRPLRDYLFDRYGAASRNMLLRVSEVAAGEGIGIDWDSALAVNTLTAHRVMWLAEREYGPAVQRELAEKLFELHFSLGGDVSDPRELTDAAVSVGMDRNRVVDFLASGEAVAEVGFEIDSARRLGIQAVPTFVFDGKYAVQGAQQIPVFLDALAKAREAGLAAGAHRNAGSSADYPSRATGAEATAGSDCEEESCEV